jgi:hypothetical protein
VSKYYKLFAALNSPQWVGVVLVLVAVQVTLELAVEPNPILSALSYVISCIFVVEIALRMWCMKHLKGSYRSFFRNIFNTVGKIFVVVFLALYTDRFWQEVVVRSLWSYGIKLQTQHQKLWNLIISRPISLVSFLVLFFVACRLLSGSSRRYRVRTHHLVQQRFGRGGG